VNPWLRRLLAGSRGRIVDELRRGPATINDLTERLDLSPNAVRSHLAALERDALVTVESVLAGTVGKPPQRYRLSAQAGTLTPKAYDAVLSVVLSAARERVGAQRYAQILSDTAARLAGDAPASGSFESRLADTRKLLAALGAAVEIELHGDRLRLTGTDCPLTTVVGSHPELCAVLADVIGKRLGTPVAHCCDRSGALPRCCFEAAVPRAG
jgi:DeoR family suf operon transcriptional repressor